MEIKRNYGIDLLRGLSMLGVVVLHILGHGGVLETAASPLGFSVSWLLEVIAYPAVNCFVLISGFVGYRAEKYYPKLRNIVSLLFTALFYSIVICLCLKFVFSLPIENKDVLKAFLPVTTSRYWFFTAYFATFIISPALNLFVHKANNKMLFIVSLAILVFCCCSTVMDPFILTGGYSFIWLSLIYILGAIIKKTDIINKVSNKKITVLLTVCYLLTWLSVVISRFIGLPTIFEKFLVSYCSPTIVIAAICLFCIFAKFRINRVNKVITFFASSAFSIYLIHDNIHIRELFIEGFFEFINNLNVAVIPILVITMALGIFVICTLIDKVRILLFNICRVKMLCEKVEKIIKRIVGFVYKKVRCIAKSI